METDATPQIVYEMIYRNIIQKGVIKLKWMGLFCGYTKIREAYTQINRELWNIEEEMREKGLDVSALRVSDIAEKKLGLSKSIVNVLLST